MSNPSHTVNIPVTRPDRTQDELVGVYYIAETSQPAPFALFLHGIPGSEKNVDIVQHLHAMGWHALILHFGGAWGSGGVYNMTLQPDDARAALDFALGNDAPAKVDLEKVVVVGFSLGTRAAILTTATDDRIKAVVSLAGFCDFEDSMLSRAFYEESASYLTGTTPDSLMQQWASLGEGLQPYEAAKQVAPRPIFLVHGTADDTVPFFHADCFVSMGGDHIQLARIEGANHTFPDHRQALIEAVIGFLKEWQN